MRIIYQCLNEMPNGPYKSPDNKIAPPSRSAMKQSMVRQLGCWWWRVVCVSTVGRPGAAPTPPTPACRPFQ